MNERFKTKVYVIANSFKLISINFRVPFTITNLVNKIMFKKQFKDIFGKLKTIIEF